MIKNVASSRLCEIKNSANLSVILKSQFYCLFLHSIKLNYDTRSKEIYDHSCITLHQRTNTYWAFGGVYVPADIYSRYLRLQGKDVAFICGSDEHGVAISMKAKKKELHRRKLLINMMELFVNRLPISEFHSTITLELLLKFIMIRLQNSLELCMIKAILLKKLPNNCTMQKPISF